MLFSIASCSFLKRSKGEVTIIKQWHFAPGVDTTDVEKFKNDPRFTNQLDIYKYATELLTTVPIPKSSLVIAEGCKGKIDESFVKSFNGWNMSKLQTWREHEDFASIMAPVAMKIKTMYPKVDVECGDDEELIKKHLLVLIMQVIS